MADTWVQLYHSIGLEQPSTDLRAGGEMFVTDIFYFSSLLAAHSCKTSKESPCIWPASERRTTKLFCVGVIILCPLMRHNVMLALLEMQDDIIYKTGVFST